MDPHLEAIPRLGSLTTGRLARGNLEDAGREADGAFDAEVLALGALDQVGGDYRIDRIVLFIGGSFRERGGSGPFSRACTLREVRVMRIRWILGPSPNSPFSGLVYDILAREAKRLLESRLLRVAMRVCGVCGLPVLGVVGDIGSVRVRVSVGRWVLGLAL